MWCYRSGLKDMTPNKPTATTLRKQTRSTSSKLSYRTKQSHSLHRVRMERRLWLTRTSRFAKNQFRVNVTAYTKSTRHKRRIRNVWYRPHNHHFDIGENAQKQRRTTVWAPGTKQGTRSLRDTLQIIQFFYVCIISANNHVSTAAIFRR